MKNNNNIINSNKSFENNDIYKDEFEEFLSLIKSNFNFVNEKLIKKAFYLNIEVNKDKILRSGLPSYTLNINIAKLLCKTIKLDDISIISALLIDNLNKSDLVDISLIRNEFGEVIAEIVEGISKIKFIETNSLNKKEYFDNYRYILMTLFKDVRILLIKLVDRVLLMQDLVYFTREEQIRYSNETLEIYVPFTNRFGLIQLKSELEDLSFKYLYPKEYAELEEKVFGSHVQRENYIQEFISPIIQKVKENNLLVTNNVGFYIYGRAKHLYSIFNKIKIRATPLENLNDIVAMRIILDTEDQNFCYFVYGLVTQLYPPIPETFKDYIALPKSNGYQSLHVALMGPQNKPVELQIRTQKMHDIAENGIAAHFIYKSGFVNAESVLNNKNALDWMETVRELIENANSVEPEILIETVKNNLFLNDIHVFSPRNQVYTFNKGATALDYAYHIHSELGLHCIGAKVNGKLVKLDYKLKSGDQIEIITSENNIIDKSNLDLVTTNKAKSIILKHLKNEEKRHIAEGQKVWTKELEKISLKLTKLHFLTVIKNSGYLNENDFYKDIYSNKIDKKLIIDTIQFGATDFISKVDRAKEKVKDKIKSSYGAIDSSNLDHSLENSVENELSSKNMQDFKLEKNKDYHLIIHGEQSSEIASEVTNILINFDDLVIKSIEIENNDEHFIGHYKISFDEIIDYKTIYQQLNTINGISKVSLR